MAFRQMVMLPVPPGYSSEEFLAQVKRNMTPHKAGLVDVQVLECTHSMDDALVASMRPGDPELMAGRDISERMVDGLVDHKVLKLVTSRNTQYRRTDITGYLVVLTDPGQVGIKQV